MGAPIEDIVCRTVDKHGLFVTAAPVVVMVSGGGDSVALLHLLVCLKDTLSLGPMQVLHVNHLLRGAASDADECFVIELARQLDIPCVVKRVDVAALCKEGGGNLENVGRQERYRLAGELLDSMCETEHISSQDGRIVTAHTADDRVETFIMRSIVGTGPGGLSSIAYLAGRVARPLLSISRSTLRDYLVSTTDLICVDDEPPLRWREDATNDDTNRFRAFVRKNIVPQCSVFNPAFQETLCRSMDLVADEDALLRDQSEVAADRLLNTEQDGTVTLDAAGLGVLPVPLRRRIVHQLLCDLLGVDARVDAKHVEQIVEGAQEPAFALSLPSGLMVRGEAGKLVFAPAKRLISPEGQLGCWLDIPGRVELPGVGIMTALRALGDAPLKGMPSANTYADVSSLQRLWVRSLRPGDSMQPFGMDGKTKKLSDILTDAKVPRHLRKNIPVVCTGPEPDADIVWLCGLRLDERYKVVPHTAERVLLGLEPTTCQEEKR